MHHIRSLQVSSEGRTEAEKAAKKAAKAAAKAQKEAEKAAKVLGYTSFRMCTLHTPHIYDGHARSALLAGR